MLVWQVVGYISEGTFVMKNDIYNIKDRLKVDGEWYDYASLRLLSKKFPEIETLPYSIRVLLINALQHVDGLAITNEHVDALISWKSTQGDATIPFSP